MQTLLEQLGEQLKKTAADNGIVVVDESVSGTASGTGATSSVSSSATTGALPFDAWVKAAAALVSGRQLLSHVDSDVEQGILAEVYPGLDEPSLHVARALLAANATVKTDAEKITSRVFAIFSDVFAVSYAGFKVGNSALKLLIAYLKASSTGTIEIDELDLLDFTTNVASLGAETSDFLSRVTKANADILTPMGLSFRFSDIIARLHNSTSSSSSSSG